MPDRNVWSSYKYHLYETNRPYGNPYRDVLYSRPRSVLDHEFGSIGHRRTLLNYPEFMDCHSGEILLSDKDNNRIQVFSCIGDDTIFNTYGIKGCNRNYLNSPSGIATTPLTGARVVVSDCNNKRVVFLQPKNDNNGNKYLEENFEFGEGVFEKPMGCAYDHRRQWMYVVDEARRRVTMHNMLTGAVVGELKCHPSLPFRRPVDCALDSRGRCYVTDAYAHLVTVYELNGNFQQSIGGYGSADDRFSEPWGICIDRTDDLLVADEGNNRVVEYDCGGRFRRVVTSDLYRPKAIGVNSHRDLVVSTHETQNFVKIIKYK